MVHTFKPAKANRSRLCSSVKFMLKSFLVTMGRRWYQRRILHSWILWRIIQWIQNYLINHYNLRYNRVYSCNFIYTSVWTRPYCALVKHFGTIHMKTQFFSVSSDWCSLQEYEIKETNIRLNDLSDDGAPDIQVTPSVINFPNIDATGGTSSRNRYCIQCWRCGFAHWRLVCWWWYRPFSLNAITSALIPPMGQAQFAVTFAPQTGD